MTDTTKELLFVNGVSVNNLAINVESLTGRINIPPRRGENVAVSGRSGRLRTKKRFDERTLVLPMWVQGCNEDGTIPTDSTASAEMYKNLDLLSSLFAPDQEIIMVHRLPDGTSRRIRGDVIDAIDFTMTQGIGKFSVSIVCYDPFWEETTAQTMTRIGSGTLLMSEMRGSTAPIEDAKITFKGPCINPQISVSASGYNMVLRYNAELGSGQTITLDCDKWALTATGGLLPDHGAVFHSGEARWFVIPPYKYAPTPTCSQSGPPNNTWSTTVVAQRKFLIG